MINDPKKTKKVRVSYFISDVLLNELKENMFRNGYDLKGKSKWISEAIEQLFKMRDYQDLVMLSNQMEGFTKLDFVTLDPDTKSLLNDAVVKIKLSHPALEGVQSKILRTAILQRILHS